MAREYAPGAYEEGRTGRVDPSYIYHVNQTPPTQHYFSPMTTKGQKKALEKVFRKQGVVFEHNLESGWTQKEKNSRKPTNKGEWRMLTNSAGNPYLAPIGPARGKFVMFDAWQSNDELMDIYKYSFEKEWVPGEKWKGVRQYADPHQHFEEPDGGHIIRIDYNENTECMMVHFKNKNSVVCYLDVPVTTIDQLRECVGKKDGSRKPPHNHLLGIRFWDLVRLRGSQTGGNYPFYYISGGPSSGKFVRNPGIVTYNTKRRNQILEEEGVRKQISSLAEQTLEDSWGKLEEIVNTESFKRDYDSGDPDKMSVDIVNFADRMEGLADASWKDKAELLKSNKNVVKDLLNSYYAREVQKEEEEGAMKVHAAKLTEDREMMNRGKKKSSSEKKSKKKRVDDYNDDDDLDASFFDVGGGRGGDDEDDWF